MQDDQIRDTKIKINYLLNGSFELYLVCEYYLIEKELCLKISHINFFVLLYNFQQVLMSTLIFVKDLKYKK